MGRLADSITLTFRMWKIYENEEKKKLCVCVCVCVLLCFGFWFILSHWKYKFFWIIYTTAYQRKFKTLAISSPKNNHIWFLVKTRIMSFTLVCNMFFLLTTHTDSIYNSHLLMIIDYDFRKGISLWGWVTPSLKWGCYINF